MKSFSSRVKKPLFVIMGVSMLKSRRNQLVIVASLIIISASLAWVFVPSILSQIYPSSNQNNLEHPWVITVDGLVNTPLNITYDELLEMPNTTIRAKIQKEGVHQSESNAEPNKPTTNKGGRACRQRIVFG